MWDAVALYLSLAALLLMHRIYRECLHPAERISNNAMRCHAVHDAKALFPMPMRTLSAFSSQPRSMPYRGNPTLSSCKSSAQTFLPARAAPPSAPKPSGPKVPKSQSSSLRVHPRQKGAKVNDISVLPLVRHPFILFLSLSARPHLVPKVFDRAGSVVLLFIAQLRSADFVSGCSRLMAASNSCSRANEAGGR